MVGAQWLSVSLLACALATLDGPAADPATQGPFRDVRLRVLDVNGHPAANRIVHLRGWAEFAVGTWGPLLDESTVGWQFLTDAHGAVTAKVGDFKPSNLSAAGWGIYALVVDPGPNDAGGVSQRFSIGFPSPFRDLAEWAPEWGVLCPCRRMASI